jgi:UPF0716 protein FxsA
MVRSRISPFAVLLLLLLSVPLLEIYLLISIGRVIGAGTTVFVVVLTAVIGAWLLRLQGLQTLRRVQSAADKGELPAVELVEGLMLLICGVLLLTPGFFTDAVGFVALVPGIRRHLAEALLKHFLGRAQTELRARSSHATIIEGTYRREDPP